MLLFAAVLRQRYWPRLSVYMSQLSAALSVILCPHTSKSISRGTQCSLETRIDKLSQTIKYKIKFYRLAGLDFTC